MKIIFYHKDFVQDLSNHNITIVEENPWFSDSFYASYSFPFQTAVEDWDKTLNPLFHHNAIDFETSYDDGKLFVHGEMYAAQMEIEYHQGYFINQQFQFGIDSFPAFDKKLNELPLEVFEVDNIMTYAKSLQGKTYPETTHVFPTIHVTKYSTSDEMYKYFKGMLNATDESGNYLTNSIDGSEVKNQNIMQPIPYLLHVVKKGFESEGYTLKGDILSNAELKKVLLYKSMDYFSENQSKEFSFKRKGTEYTETRLETHGGVQYQIGIYSDEVIVDQPGDYKLSGTVIFQYYNVYDTNVGAYFKIYFGDELVFNRKMESLDDKIMNINEVINVKEADFNKKIRIEQKSIVTQYQKYDFKIASPGVGANSIPFVYNSNEVNLKKVMHDKTFGELIEAIKNGFNFDFEIVGKEVWMNYVDNGIDRSKAIDLSNFEIEFPKRTPQKDLQFELSFKDGDKKSSYPFTKFFIDKTGVKTSDYTITDNTKKIEVDWLPLPLKKKSGITTAIDFEDNNDDFRFLLYDGQLTSNRPLTKDPVNLLIPALYNYYKRWLDFRINTLQYEWKFKAVSVNIKNLKKNSIFWAYNNFFIMKELSKTNTSSDVWEVTVKGQLWR